MIASLRDWLADRVGERGSGEWLLILLVLGAACATPTVQTIRGAPQLFDAPATLIEARYGADYSPDAGRPAPVLLAIRLGGADVASITVDLSSLAPLRPEIIAATLEDLGIIRRSLAQARQRLPLGEALELGLGEVTAFAPPTDPPGAVSPFSGPLGLPVPDVAQTAVAMLPPGLGPQAAPPPPTTQGIAAAAPGGTPATASIGTPATPAAGPAASSTSPAILAARPAASGAPPNPWVDVPTMVATAARPAASPGPATPRPDATPVATSGPAAGTTAVLLEATPVLVVPTMQGLGGIGGAGSAAGAGSGSGAGASGGGGAGAAGTGGLQPGAETPPPAEPELPVAISPFTEPSLQLQLPGQGGGGSGGGGGGAAFIITSDRTGRPTISNGLLIPGQWVSGTVRLNNPGTIPWTYSLVCEGGTGPLWVDKTTGLQLEVRRADDDTLLHRGPIAQPTAMLGELPAGEHVDLKVRVQLPRDAPNSYQGQRISIDFVWTAQTTS